ncbi:MAG: response regulator [Phenylobacterium sp.]|uniref:response regulator n=1 Tax=Phenylobacterium sp. TaxID=1871053 RepID=UPI001A5F978E|nr:response regulator [Phenylobacterium sp.]MBL8774010.1 response regulator [Phenylobacterium sp.]
MVAPADKPELRLDLRSAHVLCADSTSIGLDIIAQILHGFGVAQVVRACGPQEFRDWIKKKTFDLIIVDAEIGDHEGFELIRALRTSAPEANRVVPVVCVSGYLPKSRVVAARDCGANFVVAKPLSAGVLLDRIVWLGRHDRLFVESPNYVGPDRRFKNSGIPSDTGGRRAGDLSVNVGHPIGANMSQDEIDGMLKPQRLGL